MVGIKDIAEHLNVSQSLVSKVLNNRMGTTAVRAEIAEAIRRTALEMGYRRNESAAALTRGRHGALGVFIHHSGTAGSTLIESLLEGISDQAISRNHTLMLGFFQEDYQFRSITGLGRRNMVDGLIVAGVVHPELIPDLVAWSKAGKPVVTIYDEPMHESLVNVGLNQQAVGRMATEHLIAQGCRRIATLPVFEPRHQGYRAALAANSLPYDPALVESVYEPDRPDYDREAAMRGLHRLLDAGIEFDGLFTHSDEHAMDAERILIQTGRDIPGQVKLVGIDNAPYCELGVVPITSISQSYTQRGRLAVDLMLDLLDGKHAESCDLSPVLCPRLSSQR